jgi:hypothetical protein
MNFLCGMERFSPQTLQLAVVVSVAARSCGVDTDSG